MIFPSDIEKGLVVAIILIPVAIFLRIRRLCLEEEWERDEREVEQIKYRAQYAEWQESERLRREGGDDSPSPLFSAPRPPPTYDEAWK